MQTCVGSKAFFGNYTVSVPVEAGFDMFTSFDAFIMSQTGEIWALLRAAEFKFKIFFFLAANTGRHRDKNVWYRLKLPRVWVEAKSESLSKI